MKKSDWEKKPSAFGTSCLQNENLFLDITDEGDLLIDDGQYPLGVIDRETIMGLFHDYERRKCLKIVS